MLFSCLCQPSWTPSWFFIFFKQFKMQFLNWHGLMNQKKTVRTTREVSFLLHIHVSCWLLQYFPPFVGDFEFLNISKCSMMPRWHHSDSSSERYQEVKSIKNILCGTHFQVTGQIHVWQLDYNSGPRAFTFWVKHFHVFFFLIYCLYLYITAQLQGPSARLGSWKTDLSPQ